MAKIALLLCIFFSIIPLDSEESISGKVVAISDGDTIKIYNKVSNKQYKVRLFGIDAPEKKQDFGRKSKDALAELIHGKNVQISVMGIDQYKRVLGLVIYGNSDINLEMVKKGNAWVYRKYYKSKKYLDAEDFAKSKKIGLWSGENPIPPWKFRKDERNNKKGFLKKIHF